MSESLETELNKIILHCIRTDRICEKMDTLIIMGVLVGSLVLLIGAFHHFNILFWLGLTIDTSIVMIAVIFFSIYANRLGKLQFYVKAYNRYLEREQKKTFL